MKVLSTLLLLTSLSGIASAAMTITQTQNFAFVPNGSQAMTFNKFDTLGGTRTLVSVTITVTLNKTGGSFEVDNDSATGGTITLTHTVSGALSSSLGAGSLTDTGFSPIGGAGTLEAVNSTNQFVAATTGDATNTFNSTGLADNVVYNPGNSSVSSTGVVNSGTTALYAGTGTFTQTMTANQLVSATGLGGLQQSFTVSNVSGDVTITYNYVPEPASTMLGGLGVIVLLTRHRRR